MREGSGRKKLTGSMHAVITASFTIIAVVELLIVTSIFYMTYSRTARRQMVEYNAQLINQAQIYMTEYLRNMMRISDSVYYNVIKDTDFYTDNILSEMSLIYEAHKDNLVSIACFDKNGNLLEAVPVSTRKSNTDVTSQGWFVKAKEKPENLHFSTTHVQNLFLDSSNRYSWVISLSREVEITRRGNAYGGILLVDMNFSNIRQYFSKLNNSSYEGYTYLTDRDGNIIYHPRLNLIYSDIVSENNIAAAGYEDGAHEEVFEGQRRIVMTGTVGYTGWRIISVIPYQSIYRNSQQILPLWVAVLSIAILMILIVNAYLALRITGPLSLLDESVKTAEIMNADDIYIGGTVEIRHLGDSIRYMVRQLRHYMDQAIAEQKAKQKSELDVLQSQINPHFIYNSLDSVVWLIESGRYDESIKVVTALGRLFRISLNRGRNIITLEEEFMHAKYYSDIQLIRFRDQYQVHMEVDDAIKPCITIKLIIQPIIENAIYYGMEGMDGEGEIWIRGYEKEGDIYIEVEDNGMGMPPEQLASLLTKEPSVKKRGSGIGLYNVNKRIQLYFGEEYGLIIESEPDEGTKVTIHLPKRTEPNE